MSAFVVDTSIINEIVSYMDTSIMGTGIAHLEPYIKPLADYAGISQLPCESLATDKLKDLALALFRLNCDAVNYRYPDDQQEFDPSEYRYQFTINTTSLSALKAARCLSYQCCEGDFDRSALYQALDLFAHRLAMRIVEKSQAYQESSMWK